MHTFLFSLSLSLGALLLTNVGALCTHISHSSKQFVRGFLLYDFKEGLFTATSSRRAFEGNVVIERTVRHWFQKFRRYVRFWWILDDEALRVIIEEDNRQTCGEIAEQSKLLMKVRFHMHRIGKAYKLSKWVPYIL